MAKYRMKEMNDLNGKGEHNTQGRGKTLGDGIKVFGTMDFNSAIPMERKSLPGSYAGTTRPICPVTCTINLSKYSFKKQ